jgi:succinate dehydrogenase / fumarate reductase flavoprotein subunit
MKHAVFWVSDKGAVTADYRPERLSTWTDDLEAFPPKPRVR